MSDDRPLSSDTVDVQEGPGRNGEWVAFVRTHAPTFRAAFPTTPWRSVLALIGRTFRESRIAAKKKQRTDPSVAALGDLAVNDLEIPLLVASVPSHVQCTPESTDDDATRPLVPELAQKDNGLSVFEEDLLKCEDLNAFLARINDPVEPVDPPTVPVASHRIRRLSQTLSSSPPMATPQPQQEPHSDNTTESILTRTISYDEVGKIASIGRSPSMRLEAFIDQVVFASHPYDTRFVPSVTDPVETTAISTCTHEHVPSSPEIIDSDDATTTDADLVTETDAHDVAVPQT